MSTSCSQCLNLQFEQFLCCQVWRRNHFIQHHGLPLLSLFMMFLHPQPVQPPARGFERFDGENNTTSSAEDLMEAFKGGFPSLLLKKEVDSLVLLDGFLITEVAPLGMVVRHRACDALHSPRQVLVNQSRRSNPKVGCPTTNSFAL